MNEGQYIAIRNYLEEIASNQKQILAELKRQAAPAAEAKSDSKAVAPATADKPASKSAVKTTAAKKGK